jgi:hypothetical protein
MKCIENSVRVHTNSVDIRTVVDQEFCNLNVALDRSHMQGRSVVITYIRNWDGGDWETGTGTHRLH